MDEMKERKARDLRLKILKVERELAASQHKTGLGAMLGVAHASMMNRTADRERKRLEAKLEELNLQLAALDVGKSVRRKATPRAASHAVTGGGTKKTAAKKSAAAAKGMKPAAKNPPRPEARP